ncbi:GMC oxidoreductase [Sphaerobolus stellatus SS14]|uniref:GMC oxidoreductase n=1 Tax=Sphaerobolus stellatus (strain SS14) TaxID=990650 RepID=A0A0C9UUG2_SPHS4|nr:GMC oxidoreductase [Sphaerobolus stellatus SS14]
MRNTACDLDASLPKNRPDIEIMTISWANVKKYLISRGVSFFTTILRPTSTGTVRLKSNNPFDSPIVDPRYLSTEHGRTIMREAIKIFLRLKDQITCGDDSYPISNPRVPKSESDEDIDAFAEATHFEQEDIDGGSIPLPGVLELLDQIRTGPTTSASGWTVVTSARTRIEVSPYTLSRPPTISPVENPNPDPFATGAKILDVDPRNRTFGNRRRSKRNPRWKGAGTKVLGICTSSEREVVAAAESDWVVRDLKQ